MDEGGGTVAGNASGSSEPSASRIDGKDCRAVGRCDSFSSPDILRDSGGDSKPPSEPGTALATESW
jgi:hypothetical protein